MRVGIFISNPHPEVGGGHIFENDILTDFFKKVSDVKDHEFYIIHRVKNLDENIVKNSKKFKFLYAPKNTFFDKVCENLKRYFIGSPFFSKIKGPIERLAKKNKLDIIWFVSGYYYEAMDIPYIATVFDLQHRTQPWLPEINNNGEWARRELNYRYFLSRASYVIIGTEIGREEIQLFYQIPKFRIHKLPMPTPSYILDSDNKNSAFIKNKYNLPENFVFYPAQFWPHKNHVNLLFALKTIQEKYNLKLNLVLTGSDKGNLSHVKKIIEELDLSKQVYILGFVPKDEMAAFYKSSSMLAFVSLCGPDNLPPLEAFLIKCPVVASRIQGSEEQLGHSVLFCNPTNPEDIADKIFELFSNEKLRNELVEKGFERAISWKASNFSEGVLKIIDQFSDIRRNWE